MIGDKAEGKDVSPRMRGKMSGPTTMTYHDMRGTKVIQPNNAPYDTDSIIADRCFAVETAGFLGR